MTKLEDRIREELEKSEKSSLKKKKKKKGKKPVEAAPAVQPGEPAVEAPADKPALEAAEAPDVAEVPEEAPAATPAPAEAPAAPAPAPAPGDMPSSPVPLLEVKGLTKSFGKQAILDDISFELAEGHVMGLLGPNGAGKSTLLRVLAGLFHPGKGEVTLQGEPVGLKTKGRVSYFPEGGLVGFGESVASARSFFIKFFPDFDSQRFDELVARFKIPEKRVGHLSIGYRVRLSMALCLSRKADLYLLDEPLGNLDPLVRDDIIDLLVESVGGDAAFIITSQRVRDIESLFDDVVFLDRGKIVKQGPAELLRLNEGLSMDELYKQIYR